MELPAPAVTVGPVVLSAMGLVVHLRLAGTRAEELREELLRAWSAALVDAPDADTDANAAPDVTLDVALEDGDDLVPVLDDVSTRVTQRCLERKVGSAWLLHACALADPGTGATVVLVAPSGTGKTTAALTLGRSLAYLTDETAVVGLDGRMVPFAKPLSLLVDGRRPKRQVSPDELGLLPAPPQAHLAAVALLRREPGVEGVRVEQVPTVEALPLLAEQTSSLHLLDRPLHTVAGLVAARGGVRRLVYSEAVELLPVLTAWLRESA